MYQHMYSKAEKNCSGICQKTSSSLRHEEVHITINTRLRECHHVTVVSQRDGYRGQKGVTRVAGGDRRVMGMAGQTERVMGIGMCQ